MISIILPIRNEKYFIANTLDSILSQSVDGIEIIIADGLSTDGTREIIKAFQKENSSIILIDNPEKIVSTGFNRALSKSTGEIIIRVDGHSIIHYDYASKCKQQLNLKNCACVGGLIHPLGNSIFTKIITLATSSKFGVGNSKFHYSKISCWSDTVYLGAYKREIFEEIGGYDEELVRNQDDEYNFRMIQNDMKIWLDPSIKSTYTQRNSFMGLFKQYFQYGFYKIRVMQKRQGFASWRHLVPGLFVFGLLTSLSIFIIYGNNIPILLLCLPYLSFSLFSTILELIKSPLNHFSIMMLPLTFYILHISYGSGFLLGLIYFWNKWGNVKIKDDHFDRERFTKNRNIIKENI